MILGGASNLARRVLIDENVFTDEGEAVAQAGDWIVQGERLERWPVPDVRFQAGYEGPIDTRDDRG